MTRPITNQMSSVATDRKDSQDTPPKQLTGGRPVSIRELVRNSTSTSAKEIPKYKNASPVKLSLDSITEKPYRMSIRKPMVTPVPDQTSIPQTEQDITPRTVSVETPGGTQELVDISSPIITRVTREVRKGSIDSVRRNSNSTSSPVFPMSPFQQSRKDSGGSTSQDDERREIYEENSSDADENLILQEVEQQVTKMLEHPSNSIYYLKNLLRPKHVEGETSTSQRASPVSHLSKSQVEKKEITLSDTSPQLKFSLPTTSKSKFSTSVSWKEQLNKIHENNIRMDDFPEWKRVLMYNNHNNK